jgi:hypothetical protein
VLTREGALPSFISYFVIFAPGHDLTGGFVIPWTLDGQAAFMMAGPVVALLVSAAYFSVHLAQRRPLDTRGWVMVAAAALTAVYYTKFLDRADPPHLAESYWVAFPLIALVLFELCDRLDGVVTRIPRIAPPARSLSLRPVALVLLLATALLAPASLVGRAETLAHQYRASAPSDPWQQQLGYAKGGMDEASYDDLRTVLRSYLGPNDWIFDFSNAPGLYYYLLGNTPHTRYYHVSMALPSAAQEDLISELRRDPPKLVVFSNDRYGAPNWDMIPDVVRHYDVSQYLLQHYRPLLSIRGQIIYARTGTELPPPQSLDPYLREKVATDDLPFRVGTCSWGYSPNFLSTSPAGAAPTTARFTPVPPTDATIQGWFADPSLTTPVQQVALLLDGQVTSATSDLPPRPDKADPIGPVGSSARGFELAVPRSALAAAHSIQVATVSPTGEASFVPFDGAARKLPAGTVPAGSTARGAVESVVSNPHAVEIAPPPGKTWASYRWLEIDSRSGFRPDTFSLSDRMSADPGRSITFQTLETSPHTYRVQVASCAQWHAYDTRPLFLSSESSQSIASIKLVP